MGLGIVKRDNVHAKNTTKFKANALTKLKALSFASFWSSVFSTQALLVGALRGPSDDGGPAMVMMCGWYSPRQQSGHLTFFRNRNVKNYSGTSTYHISVRSWVSPILSNIKRKTIECSFFLGRPKLVYFLDPLKYGHFPKTSIFFHL